MASAEISKIQSKLSALSTSLDEIESVLEPLLSASLAESIVNLEPLQQAKLQTVLPYAVYDLVFMYLKLEGVDPKTHPVIGELGRIKEYFDKISNTENPPQRRVEIDQAAAGRFIKAAITQAKWRKTAAEDDENDQGGSDQPEASTSTASVLKKTITEQVPVKVTAKMLERQKYQEEVRRADAEGEEEEGLQVFDDQNQHAEKSEDEEGDGQAMLVDEPAKEQAGGRKKRARPVLDPFQGYGDDADSKTPTAKVPSPAETPSQPTPTESSESPKKKKRKSSTAGTSGPKKKKAK